MISINEMVNRLLSEGGFSQPALAALVGVSQPTINRISKGSKTSYESGKKIESIYSAHFDCSKSSLQPAI